MTHAGRDLVQKKKDKQDVKMGGSLKGNLLELWLDGTGKPRSAGGNRGGGWKKNGSQVTGKKARDGWKRAPEENEI